jgi:hypothetical protein
VGDHAGILGVVVPLLTSDAHQVPIDVSLRVLYLTLASAVIRTLCSPTSSTFTTIDYLIPFPDFVAGVREGILCYTNFRVLLG